MNKTIGFLILLSAIGISAFIFYLNPKNTVSTTTAQVADNSTKVTNLAINSDMQTANTVEVSANDVISQNNSAIQQPADKKQAIVANETVSDLKQILNKIQNIQINPEGQNIDDLLTDISSVDSVEDLYALQDFVLQNLLYPKNTDEETIKYAIQKRLATSQNSDLVGFKLSELYFSQRLTQEQTNELLLLDLPALHNQIYVYSHQQEDQDTAKKASIVMQSSQYMTIDTFVNLSHKVSSQKYQQDLVNTFSIWLEKNPEKNIIAIKKMINVGDINSADKNFLQNVIVKLEQKRQV